MTYVIGSVMVYVATNLVLQFALIGVVLQWDMFESCIIVILDVVKILRSMFDFSQYCQMKIFITC